MLAEHELQQPRHLVGEIECGGASTTLALRSLCGWDEHALGDGNGALQLLQRVATVDDGGTLELDHLPVALIDRLVAHLYIELYGPEAECQVDCSSCHEKYEFALDLHDLMAFQDEARERPDESGSWATIDGRRVRAPQLRDLRHANDPDFGARFMVEGDYDADPKVVDDLLERVAPILTLDLQAVCPSCAATQAVRFNLAHYLSHRLLDDRKFLLREVHLLASTYQWSQSEILNLSQVDRRALAAMVEGERSARQRVRL